MFFSSFSYADLWVIDTALIEKGIDYSLKQKFDSSIVVFKNYTNKYPNSPVGYYMLSILYATFMTDLETFSKEKELYRSLNKGVELVEKCRVKNVWYYYFKGAFKIVESAYLTRKGKMKSIYKGFSGIDDIKDGEKLDKSNGDIQFYLGFYYYAKGVVGKKFSWLGFSGDKNTKKAIKLLQYASKKSIFGKEVSVQTMVNILSESNEFMDAEKIGLEFYKKNNNNRSIMWALAKLYKKWGKKDSSIFYYTRLYKQFDLLKKDYPYNYFSLCYQLGILYKSMENFEMAKKYFNFNIQNQYILKIHKDKRIKKFVSMSKDELEKIEEQSK